jgi:hypothetical protein
MSLTYDPKKWKLKPGAEGGRYRLSLASGDAHALIISERITIPAESWPAIILKNAQHAGREQSTRTADA